MRTTRSIDDDILTVAKDLTEREHRTIGAVISALAREALRTPVRAASTRNGLPLLPVMPGAGRASNDLVNQLWDDPVA